MTVNGDTMCSLIQSFPVLLILAQNHNWCLNTKFIYKPPSPTQTPEYYEALDALFQTLFSNGHDCNHHYGHGHHGYNYGGAGVHVKPYFIPSKPSYGYPGYSHGYSSHGYGSGSVNAYGSCHGHGQGYPMYGYKKINLYNVSGVKYGNSGYAPGNQVYHYNNHKYKVVVKRSKHGKMRFQKFQVIPCTTKHNEDGTCVEVEDCSEYDDVDDAVKEDLAKDVYHQMQCNSNETDIMVCCPNNEVSSTVATPLKSEESAGDTNVFSSDTYVPKVTIPFHYSKELINRNNGNLPELVDQSIPLSQNTIEKIVAIIMSNSSSSEDNADDDIDDYMIELPRHPHCGVSNVSLTTKTTNIQPAKIGDFPWMALLGYKSKRGTLWKCGGSIITVRHVLTAAHCINGYEDRLHLVRIGEIDWSKDDDGANPVDIPIKLKFSHELYNKTAAINDIGILFLNNNINFKDAVVPICLPIKPDIGPKTVARTMPFVAAWGLIQNDGQNKSHLQMNQVLIHANLRCSRAFSKKTINQTNICAGVPRAGKDLCTGDTGGPFMVPIKISNNYFFYQIGLMSYTKKCSKNDVPGVYTRISQFMPWIFKIVTGKDIV